MYPNKHLHKIYTKKYQVHVKYIKIHVYIQMNFMILL